MSDWKLDPRGQHDADRAADAKQEASSEVERDYCPYCGEQVQSEGDDYIEVCPEHGVLEGISDEEWARLTAESEGTEEGGRHADHD